MIFKSLSGELLAIEDADDTYESLRAALDLPYHHILTVLEDTSPRLFFVDIVTVTPRIAATLLVFVPFQSFLTSLKMSGQDIDELPTFPTVNIPYPFENYLERYQELVHNPELVIANQPRNFFTKFIRNDTFETFEDFEHFECFETLYHLPDLTTPEMREWFDILGKEYEDMHDEDRPTIEDKMMLFLDTIDTKYGLFAADMDFVYLVHTVAEYLSLFSMYLTESNMPSQLAAIVSKYNSNIDLEELITLCFRV